MGPFLAQKGVHLFPTTHRVAPARRPLAFSRSRPSTHDLDDGAVRSQCRPITPRRIAVLSTFLITKSNQTEAVAEAEAKAIAHSHFTLPYGVRVYEGTFLLK